MTRNYSTLDKKLQDVCQEIIGRVPRHYSKMIEYMTFLLLCTLVALVAATAHYVYSILRMAEASLNDILPEVTYDPDVKREKLIECVLTRNSKQYLVKGYTEEQINKRSAEEVNKLFSNYEVKLSGTDGKVSG